MGHLVQEVIVMMVRTVFVSALLLCFVALATSKCVPCPEGVSVCHLKDWARVPESHSSLDPDRAIVSLFDYYREIDHLPTYDCAEAYTDFQCSVAYPRCTGDKESGLSYAVPVCQSACEAFVKRCKNELPGIERPDCGQYSTTVDCTHRGKHPRKIDISEWYGSPGSTVAIPLFVSFVAALFSL